MIEKQTIKETLVWYEMECIEGLPHLEEAIHLSLPSGEEYIDDIFYENDGEYLRWDCSNIDGTKFKMVTIPLDLDKNNIKTKRMI